MTRKIRIPSYRFHKGSNQAVVVLSGRSVYLGHWNSPESRAEYERVVAEWLANGRRPVQAVADEAGKDDDLTVNEMILAFWDHATTHYRHADGSATGEQANLKHALRPLRRLCGHTVAKEFGPLALRAIQGEMAKEDLCRGVINARVNRIRRAFRWVASMELIPVSVPASLATVPPLLRGRCDARESPGVKPVEWALVEATLPHLPRTVAAMVQVMRYSNCRAEDVVILRGCDIQMDGVVWRYAPSHHKNRFREDESPVHRRVVLFGPRCQEILRPFLKPDPEAYLFSPREAKAEHQATRAAERKSKRTPSEMRRRRKKAPGRAPRERYDVNSFQQTVRRTCLRAKLDAWTLLQVRHARATEVRQGYGLEGAAASLGDKIEATSIYAEKNQALAERIAHEIG
ncbi:MAG: hypothetical protein K2W96_20270 [Gemmataceae bacterium]|nr:hypothetical protein [Gemmataceae bacterium]